MDAPRSGAFAIIGFYAVVDFEALVRFRVT